MNATTDRARRDRNIRALADRIKQHLRLQRELLWHPRLGLVGRRHPIPVAVNGGRRSRLSR
jgi:hypothetical protein